MTGEGGGRCDIPCLFRTIYFAIIFCLQKIVSEIDKKKIYIYICQSGVPFIDKTKEAHSLCLCLCFSVSLIILIVSFMHLYQCSMFLTLFYSSSLTFRSFVFLYKSQKGNKNEFLSFLNRATVNRGWGTQTNWIDGKKIVKILVAYQQSPPPPSNFVHIFSIFPMNILGGHQYSLCPPRKCQ